MLAPEQLCREPADLGSASGFHITVCAATLPVVLKSLWCRRAQARKLKKKRVSKEFCCVLLCVSLRWKDIDVWFHRFPKEADDAHRRPTSIRILHIEKRWLILCWFVWNTLLRITLFPASRTLLSFYVLYYIVALYYVAGVSNSRVYLV